MTAYMVLKLRKWQDFEPAPGSFAPFPVSIQPEGLGFCVVYATMEEAEANANGGMIVGITILTDKEHP